MTNLGKKGEDIASNYLINNGFYIIKKNFHFGRYGEIDIIAEKNDTLFFIEVKSRNNEKFGDPLYSINYKKQANLRKTAEGYLYINKINNKQCQFDVIIVNLQKGIVEKHIENAF